MSNNHVFVFSLYQEEQDLDRLHVIHRYRPHSPDVAALTENGKVLGYTRHVGSALHGDHYVDFYLKEGKLYKFCNSGHET